MDSSTEASAPEMEWDELAPGGEISATVIMASGFVLQEGQRVRERYRIEGVLGEGAMGQVLAVTLVGSGDHQTYALKVVARPASADSGETRSAEAQEAARHAQWFAELLRQEAAKQDVVQRHGVPVARLFALVRLDDGSIGMRMELARGRSLESQVDEEKEHKDEPPEVLWSVSVVRKLVSQLRRLHELVDTGSAFGFVHSDIKPGNVFVDDSDPSDVQVTLLDFGVATAGQALAHDIGLRDSGRKTFVLQQTGGTIGYAPPFHFNTKPTPLSDVHAAVVILYELITGEPPWNFGDMPLEAEHIPELETFVLQGARPVKKVRPSVAQEDARVLDDFFTKEFKELHELARTLSREIADGEKEAPRELKDKLNRLAREYQGKLDQLRKRLSPSRRPDAVLTEAPVAMPAIPRAPGVPSFPGLGLDSDPRPSMDVSAMSLTRRKPKLIVMASSPPPPMGGGHAQSHSNKQSPRSATRKRTTPREASKPEAKSAATGAGPGLKKRSTTQWIKLTRRYRWLPWALAALGVFVVGSIVYGIARLASPPDAPAHPLSPLVIHSPSSVLAAQPSTPASAVVPVATAAPPARTPPVANAPTPSERALLSALATAPIVEEPAEEQHHHHHHHHGSAGGTEPALPSGAQHCACLSVVQGAQVVARGGTLGHEEVLCSATTAAAPGRVEFYGSGVLPAAVIAASPEVICRADGASLQLSVQRYSTESGLASLFQCR